MGFSPISPELSFFLTQKKDDRPLRGFCDVAFGSLLI
ncbi:hypothetical protein M621_16305 [Serratia plymuthica S13]|uniref:Uncharacterized protein n=1 Tax=Serratia plymuthica S13 TaxID=1348660 RepID=S4YSE3_SERPL|nr:hypothetical protein M621_16305 [Serratia plymuthica S13]